MFAHLNMKKSYKHSLAAVATAVIIFNFTSCKYEDGPKISLKSKTARLAQNWDVKTIDGESLGSELSYELDFDKDGGVDATISFSYYGYSGEYDMKGDWEWGSKKESVILDLDGDVTEFEITKLTSSELNWEYDYDGETSKWEMESN